MCFYILGSNIPTYSWLLSCAFTSLSSVYARLFTPFYVELPSNKKYNMNINSAYYFWKDVSVTILHCCEHKPAWIYLPFLIVVGNVLLNGPPYFLLNLVLS